MVAELPLIQHRSRSRGKCTTWRRLRGRARLSRRFASSMVAAAAVVSRPRGRRWRRARRLRHIRRARRGLKFIGVVASRTARAVAADGRSLRAAAGMSTAGGKPAAGCGLRATGYGRRRQPKRSSDAHSDARSMRSRVASFETGRIQQAMGRAPM